MKPSVGERTLAFFRKKQNLVPGAFVQKLISSEPALREALDSSGIPVSRSYCLVLDIVVRGKIPFRPELGDHLSAGDDTVFLFFVALPGVFLPGSSPVSQLVYLGSQVVSLSSHRGEGYIPMVLQSLSRSGSISSDEFSNYVSTEALLSALPSMDMQLMGIDTFATPSLRVRDDRWMGKFLQLEDSLHTHLQHLLDAFLAIRFQDEACKQSRIPPKQEFCIMYAIMSSAYGRLREEKLEFAPLLGNAVKSVLSPHTYTSTSIRSSQLIL